MVKIMRSFSGKFWISFYSFLVKWCLSKTNYVIKIKSMIKIISKLLMLRSIEKVPDGQE